VIDGTGIATDAIAARFASGESTGELMADYELSRQQVEAALRRKLRDRYLIKAIAARTLMKAVAFVAVVVIYVSVLGIVLHF